MANANQNRAYIYTKECNLCGNTEAYAHSAKRLQAKGKEVFVKQVSLFAGWTAEAEEIGLEMPFVLDYDTMHKATCADLDNMSEEELEEWLGIRS